MSIKQSFIMGPHFFFLSPLFSGYPKRGGHGELCKRGPLIYFFPLERWKRDKGLRDPEWNKFFSLSQKSGQLFQKNFIEVNNPCTIPIALNQCIGCKFLIIGVLTHVVQFVVVELVVELVPTKLHGNLGPMGVQPIEWECTQTKKICLSIKLFFSSQGPPSFLSLLKGCSNSMMYFLH